MFRPSRRAALVAAAATLAGALPAQDVPDWSAVDRALGRAGTAGPANVMRYSFPRTDLTVMVGDLRIRPAFALGSWVGFLATGRGSAMVMGDLVLTAEEYGPVMRRLQVGGVSFSALHHHLVGESPRVLYLHISGYGHPVLLAGTIRSALTISTTPFDPPAISAQPSLDLDTAAVARALGVSGRANGGVYQVSVPRSEKIVEQGHEIPPSMGLATAINFQPVGGGKAAITGDFVLLGSEVVPVQQALTERGIQPTSLHSHLVDEEPRLYFMHFWAVDDAVTLARALRAALDRTHSAFPR